MPFIYPTAYEFSEIQPDLLQRGREGRLGMDIMPERPVNIGKVRWTQRDNYTGLQQFRGLDGEPLHVIRLGRSIYEYEPGVFGEFEQVTETELTERAASLDVPTQPIDIEDLVMECDTQLIGREFERKESSIWAVLTTGTISIKIDGPNGVQTGYQDQFTIQTFTAPISWGGAPTTAVPIQNMQSVQQLGLAAGHSVDFGAGATAYLNQVTANRMLNNQNNNDLNGRRTNFGATINNLENINQFMLAQNLPRFQIYDNGYLPSPGAAFTKFIPDNKVVVIGKRPGNAKIGEYLLTRNASNGFRPGSYRYVIDKANGGGISGEKKTPANIVVHRGHNGGPVIYYPSAIVVMNV